MLQHSTGRKKISAVRSLHIHFSESTKINTLESVFFVARDTHNARKRRRLNLALFLNCTERRRHNSEVLLYISWDVILGRVGFYHVLSLQFDKFLSHYEIECFKLDTREVNFHKCFYWIMIYIMWWKVMCHYSDLLHPHCKQVWCI